MSRIIEKFFKIVPRYSLIPEILIFVLNSAVYWGTKLLNHNWFHYDLTLPIDEAIPIVPFFIFFYVIAYVQWVVGYIVIGRESEEVCYRVLSGQHISKFICAVFFLAMPTMIARVPYEGTGFYAWTTEMLYKSDTPTNLFPSIHCLESWLCLRCSINLKKPPAWYKYVMLFITVGVFASVVFVKQHFFIDIIGGILVGELGLLISRVTGAGRIYKKLNEKIWKPKSNTSEN